VISTIKYIKLLGNSSSGINSLPKRRLYRYCTLPITLYGFPLWYYNKAFNYYHFNILRKMQQRAALWIIGAFRTSSTLGVKTIASLVLIYLHLKKLYRRFLLQQFSLPSNHIIHSILSFNRSQEQKYHNTSIDYLMAKQRIWLKSPLININEKHNKIFPSFCFFNDLNLEIILLIFFQIDFLFILVLQKSKSI